LGMPCQTNFLKQPRESKMSKATMEFDLADLGSREQHEHAADGFRYFRVIEELAGNFVEKGDTHYSRLLEHLSKKHAVPRVRDVSLSRGMHNG